MGIRVVNWFGRICVFPHNKISTLEKQSQIGAHVFPCGCVFVQSVFLYSVFAESAMPTTEIVISLAQCTKIQNTYIILLTLSLSLSHSFSNSLLKTDI